MTGGPDLDVEIGVQVPQPIASNGEVVGLSSAPAGRAAHHNGTTQGCRVSTRRVFTWCEEKSLSRSLTCWEIYDDHHEDPAKRRTDVYHLIAE